MLWAFLLGLFLVFMAVATANADHLHLALSTPALFRFVSHGDPTQRPSVRIPCAAYSHQTVQKEAAMKTKESRFLVHDDLTAPERSSRSSRAP